MSEPVIVTYVKYMSPETIVTNETVREVLSRDPQRAAREAPESAFGFVFFERVAVTAEIGGEKITTASGERNVSATHYIGGEIMTAGQVEALPGDHKILLFNMRGNHWDRVIRARHGWFQPFRDDDVLVSTS